MKNDVKVKMQGAEKNPVIQDLLPTARERKGEKMIENRSILRWYRDSGAGL